MITVSLISSYGDSPTWLFLISIKLLMYSSQFSLVITFACSHLTWPCELAGGSPHSSHSLM